jgi:formylglycine-generating enzyme required for sulfatase activity
MRPLRVFLCHASQDKPAVWKLHRYLKQRGVQPWLDQTDLLPGEDWEVEIPNALLSSDVILVCLSKNSVDKEGYVQKEISFALDKALEKPEGTIFVIPVKLEECELPRRLNRYQWVELFRPDGRKRLLMGLNKRVKGLAPDVSPVILEDTRRRRPVSEPVMDQPKREAGETAARQAAEGLAREKAAREKREREQKERADREAKEFLRRQTNPKPHVIENHIQSVKVQKTPTPKLAKPVFPKILWFGTLIVILLFCSWGAYELAPRQPTPNPYYLTESAGLTQFPMQTQSAGLTQFPMQTQLAERTQSAGLTQFPMQTQLANISNPPPTFPPNPGIGSTMISEKDGMVMVFVPAGEFTMSSDTGESDEKPVHQVYLDSFWIDQTEVTNAMYAKCVYENQCDPPKKLSSLTRSNYFGNSEFDTYPVLYVDWNMANAYCSWAGRRLPTESEWEKAARGTDGRTYPWGNTFGGTLVNFCDTNCSFSNANKSFNDGYADVAPVGSYPSGQSPYGALDMAGNVGEWVSSLYQSYPYSADDGREDLSAPGTRVLRGGSWLNSGSNVRSAYRLWSIPANSDFDLGFRCSLSHP